MSGTELGCLGTIIVCIVKLFVKFIMLVAGITCISVGVYYIFVSSRSLLAGFAVENLILHLILSIIAVILRLVFLRFVLFKNKKHKEDSLQGES